MDVKDELTDEKYDEKLLYIFHIRKPRAIWWPILGCVTAVLAIEQF